MASGRSVDAVWRALGSSYREDEGDYLVDEGRAHGGSVDCGLYRVTRGERAQARRERAWLPGSLERALGGEDDEEEWLALAQAELEAPWM